MDSKRQFSFRSASAIGAVGFWSLAGAVAVAHLNPATEYELSIYTATPVGFWIGVGIAFLSGAALAFAASNGELRVLGILLGGLASTAVVSLPIVRGYFFHGIHDSVTHVGITRELTAGAMYPHESFYPGIHTLATFIHGFTGFSLWRSLLVVSVVTVIVSFVFTALVVRELVGGEAGTAIGAFSAFLLIPIHQLAGTLHPHPSSQATLIAPLALFLLVGYLRSPNDGALAGLTTPVGLALLLALFASILYHPQHALNLITLFVAISLLQAVIIPRTDSLDWADHHSLHAITVVFVLAYAAWVSGSSGFLATISGAVTALSGYFEPSGTAAGSAVSSQASALRAIGSSLATMYVKLFLVSTVYIVLAGVTFFLAVSDSLRRRIFETDASTMVYYLSSSLLGMLAIFLLYFFGNVGQYYFRQASFMMLIVVVLGAVALAYGVRQFDGISRNTFETGLVVGFTVMFVLSTLVLFNSPYVNRATQHVTEAKVDGYETTFDVTNESAVLAGVRQEPQRYYEAVVDLRDNGNRDGTVDSTNITRLQDRQDGEWFLLISQNTYEREVIAYEEYRYSRADLTAPDNQADVNLVHTNGDTTLYHVP